MRRHLLHAVAVLAAALLVAIAVPRSSAAQDAEPQAAVLAIVSPIVWPACSVAGSTTLLVPVVSGLVGDQVPIPEAVDIGALLLDGLGPIFVVCAELPAPPGSRCELDDQIAGVWPQEVGGLVPLPPVVGHLADAVDAVAAAAGLPAEVTLQEPLTCYLPQAEEAVAPPAIPPPVRPPVRPPSAPVPTSTASLPALGAVAPSVGGRPAIPGTPATPAANRTPVATIPMLDAVSQRIPGGLIGLQVIAAVLLAAFLTGSWSTSFRLSRASSPTAPE